MTTPATQTNPAPAFWANQARVALSLVINVEEGSELAITRGDETMEPVDELGMFAKGALRNLPNESNYRYGLNAGAPRVARLLGEFGMQATWTCAAEALAAAPEIVKLIAAGNHEVCAHGNRWIPQHRMDEDAEREFIRSAAETIERTTGNRPLGWLSRYFYTLNTRRLLVEQGYRYHMDDFSDDLPFWDCSHAQPLLIIPYQLDTNDMKMWAHPSYTPDQWLKYACDTLDWLRTEAEQQAAPRIMSLGVHLRIIGRPGRIWALRAFLEHVAASSGVCVMTRGQILGACSSPH